MGRLMPVYCEHGAVADWGDFGDEDNPTADTCPQCAAAPSALDVARRALAEIADGGCTNVDAACTDPGDRCDPCTAQAALDATGGTP